MSDGSFGLSRELAIANSKVREVFTPFTPINIVDHFFGREEQVAKLVSIINSPGQHALLYGDRGVGKTSLATVTCHLITRSPIFRGKFFFKRCDSEDTFASIFREPLRYVGIDYEVTEEMQAYTMGGEAKLKVPLMGGGVDGRRTKTIRRVPQNKVESPSWVAARLEKIKGLFLIDEADALTERHDRKKVAALIKFLSDSGSKFKLIIVGVAQTGEEITAGHPSIERCLKETPLYRMTGDELRKIVSEGMKRLKMSCSEEVVETIVTISAGYPHFTHLICLKCAENAIVARKRQILSDDLAVALRDAVSESEGVLKRRYYKTIRSTKHESEYVSLLLAAANCPTPTIRLSNLQCELESRLGISIARSVLSRYMTAMLAKGDKGVFVRVNKGVYRFSDPRMPSFIQMVGSSAR